MTDLPTPMTETRARDLRSGDVFARIADTSPVWYRLLCSDRKAECVFHVLVHRASGPSWVPPRRYAKLRLDPHEIVLRAGRHERTSRWRTLLASLTEREGLFLTAIG